MAEMLILADDLTGALDTGVQFASKGAATRVITDPDHDFSTAADKTQILVVNTETRHLSPDEAYRIVFSVVQRGRNCGCGYIYKKTDSALRGNIGSELQAVLDAAGEQIIHFIPALPAMGRCTVDGVHYVDGRPVSESVFGQDPFEPVRFSNVAEIIHSQAEVPVYVCGKEGPSDNFSGICVHNAASQQDIEQTAAELNRQGNLRLMAGCAGFAAVLPEFLNLSGCPAHHCPLKPPLLVACGSINPITLAQLDQAEKSGFVRWSLTPEERSSPAWVNSPACHQFLTKWAEQLHHTGRGIIDVTGKGQPQTACTCMAADSADQVRQQIAKTIGKLLQQFLEQSEQLTLMVTGGDTLLAFMRCLNVVELTPHWEAAPGIVLSSFIYRGNTYNLLSKSGGFGKINAISELGNRIWKP